MAARRSPPLPCPPGGGAVARQAGRAASVAERAGQTCVSPGRPEKQRQGTLQRQPVRPRHCCRLLCVPHGGLACRKPTPSGAHLRGGGVAGLGPCCDHCDRGLDGPVPGRHCLGEPDAAAQHSPAVHGHRDGVSPGRRPPGLPRLQDREQTLRQAAARPPPRPGAGHCPGRSGCRLQVPQEQPLSRHVQPAQLVWHPGLRRLLHTVAARPVLLPLPRDFSPAPQQIQAAARLLRRLPPPPLHRHLPAGHPGAAPLQDSGHVQLLCPRRGSCQRLGPPAGCLWRRDGLRPDPGRVAEAPSGGGAGPLHGFQEAQGGREPGRPQLRPPARAAPLPVLCLACHVSCVASALSSSRCCFV